MSNKQHHFLTGLLAGGVSFLALAASAQTPPPQPQMKVEEVVVTAQKRSENVRKVPVSITVLSGAKIRADHIQNFSDLSQAVPNLSFSSQAGEGLSTLEIRGIASQAGTATVALYLDDVSLTTRNIYTQGTAEPRFLDISRVEVLRGPQSTLYGASAMGGLVRYISNQPDPTSFGGNVFSELSGTYHGGGPNWDEQGTLNIPFGNGKAALRVSAETGSDAGYISNINPATGDTIKGGINSTNFNVARAAMLLQPTDWLTITPSAFWQSTEQHDSDAEYLELPNFQTPKTVAEPGLDKLFVPSVTINADLGFANLISVTSSYQRSFQRTLDSTIYDNLSLYVCDPLDQALTCTDDAGNPVYNAPPGLYQALFNLPSKTFYDNQVHQYQQEIRLVSKPYDPESGGLPFTWLAGLYASSEYAKATDNEVVIGANAAFARFNADPSDPTVISGGAPGFIINDKVYSGLQAYDTAQYAIFGEATYHPTPAIRITAGGRYLYARDGEDSDNEYFYSYGLTGYTGSVGHFYAFTPKFAFDWDLSSTNSVYANISKGFRLGSENRAIAFIPNQVNAFGTPSYDLNNLGIHSSPTQYGPDKLWNFEIGDKGRFFGGRLVASADFFYILWQDIQQEVPLTSSGLDFETNAGNAKSYGIEFETRGRITDSLTAGLSGGYTHAALDNGVHVGNTVLAGTEEGEIIPGVPRFNFDFDARQNFTLSDEFTGFVTMNVPWVGRSHGEPIGPTPGSEVDPSDYNRPSYITLDAAVGLDYGRWEFTMFGKNLTNNNKVIQQPDIQGSGVDTPGQAGQLYGFNYRGTQLSNTQGFTLRPLTVGMNAALKF